MAPEAALHALSEPWQDPLTRRAMVEVVLLGMAGGALGCWTILYGLSYSAESLAHSLFPGLVVAALAGFPLLLGGAAGILVAAVGVVIAGRLPTIGADTAVAVVVTTLFGLGALLALSPASPPGIEGLLFGEILGVSDLDLGLAAGLVALVALALWLGHERLLAVGFDRPGARALGISGWAADAAVLVLLALAILVAVQGLGNLLVVAVLIAPAATARRLARRAGPMIVLAAAVGVVTGVGGLYLSYYARTAAGASIAAVMVGAYLAVSAISSLTPRRRPAASRPRRFRTAVSGP